MQQCATLGSTTQHGAISCKNRSQNGPGRSSEAPKIESKSVPGRSWDAPWHPRAFQKRPRSVQGRPRHVPEAPRECPKAPRDVKKGVREGLGACRGVQNRCQVMPGSENIRFFVHSSFEKQRWNDFVPILVHFRLRCKVCEPLKVLRLPAKTKGRPSAVRVQLRTRCNSKKPRRSITKRQFWHNFDQF